MDVTYDVKDCTFNANPSADRKLYGRAEQETNHSTGLLLSGAIFITAKP